LFLTVSKNQHKVYAKKQIKTWAEKHILLEHGCSPIIPAW